MPKLTQKAIVETPFAQAADLVERFLLKEADKNGDIVLGLSAPGAGMNLPGVRLERKVTAKFHRIPGPNQTIVFQMTWVPAGGGPYPTFAGTLTVAEDETYKTCRLLLEGSYRPPFGAAGAIFNVLFGSRVARETAKELLQNLRSFLNSGYQEVEREKRLRVLLGHQGA